MLYQKYEVRRKVAKPGQEHTMISVDTLDVDSPFVLMPRKDPAAMVALQCYADFCEPELGRQIKRWIQRIKQAPKILGTQGKRNRPFCKAI